MSLLNLVVIIIAFAVLFKYVVPFLFPAVVKGEYVVNPRELLRNKKRDDQGEDDAAGLDENFVVRGGIQLLVGCFTKTSESHSISAIL